MTWRVAQRQLQCTFRNFRRKHLTKSIHTRKAARRTSTTMAGNVPSLVDHGRYLAGGDGESFGVHITYENLYLAIFFLASVYSAGMVASKMLKMPALVGEIFCGIVLGPSLLNFVRRSSTCFRSDFSHFPSSFLRKGTLRRIICVAGRDRIDPTRGRSRRRHRLDDTEAHWQTWFDDCISWYILAGSPGIWYFLYTWI